MFGRLTLFLKTGISFFLMHLLKTLGEFLFNIMIVLVLSFNLGPRRLNCLNYICQVKRSFICEGGGGGGGGVSSSYLPVSMVTQKPITPMPVSKLIHVQSPLNR